MKRFDMFALKPAGPLAAGVLLAALVLGLVAVQKAGAVDNKKEKGKEKAQEYDPETAPTNFPEAVFELSASAKDPFFPMSTRSAIPAPTAPTNAAPSVINAASFRLSGMITDPEGGNGMLVIINGHSFAQGETFSVAPLTGGPKVNVTVARIKQYSAVIQVEGIGEEREIYLPDGAR